MRNLLFVFLLLSSPAFAQRDSIISKIKCHLISESDTGTAWIQTIVVKKGVKKYYGTYFEFYPDGKLKAKGYYKKGKRTEKWMRYYSNGQIKEEGYFDGGYKTELWKTYYESGKMSWKGNFFKNMRSGIWRYFYEDGTVKGMTRYRIKTESVAKKAKSGSTGRSFRVNREITYSISPADSLVEYYPDGKLRTRIIYGKEGGLTGDIDLYYADGKRNMHGKYLNAQKTGDWTYYCMNGAVFKTEHYPRSPIAQLDNIADCFYDKITPWMKWEVELITP
jgi:antitoxin component YwqK of YwqJK toxin-antitoxin module